MRRARCGPAVATAVWAVAAASVAQVEPAPPAPQREILEQLRALNAAALEEGVPVGSLFAARLDELASVEERLAAAEDEVEEIGADPARATDSDLALRRELAVQRAAYLDALARVLRRMPEASRRILPSISEPRAALREHAARAEALADELEQLAERVARVESRLASGALVGFVKEARDVAADLGELAADLRARGAQLRELAGAERALAEAIESEARALRRGFLTTLRAPDRQRIMDEAFLVHLEAQRRLQRSASRARAPEQREVEALIQTVAALTPERRLGTVAEAAALVEPLGELVARVDALIAASSLVEDQWRLAFENEVVTVLASQISPAVRREAYALSTSLLRDARAEAALAWRRAREGWRALRAEVPDLTALFGGPRGRAWLVRALGLAAVVGAWWLARRYTGALVVGAVRIAAARRSGGRYGIRLGTLVRWSGLFQAVLPVLFAWLALWVALRILGSGVAEALVVAVAVPVLCLALGMQLLVGCTRRITAGRPALIEVPPALLPQLQRTYARLGGVVAVAAVLVGVARVVIGQGVIATWVTVFALLWVGVWAAWEALAWRPALARAWLRRIGSPGEGAEPGLARRLAGWMERSRWGAALSPLVALRLALGWLESVLVELSRRTDLAELLEARRLRRAARSGEEQPASARVELPEEYLREFPLLPILGEDDALLIPREAIVAEVLEQLQRWRESRVEGSTALIGEKGSGKTTLAALVARRMGDATVVQHILRNKPRGREELHRALAPSLPVTGAEGFDGWVEGLCAGPDRVVILDEAHNIFLRTVGGYEAYDALVELVNATGQQVFWILLFNAFTWRFLDESRSGLHFFRRLLYLPPWSSDEIRDLIRRRHQRTGFDVEFDEMLLSGDRGGNGRLELVEGAEGFFRLLRETSGGNPRIATRLWLSSLSVTGEKKLRVSTFREPRSEALDGISDDLCFALAAICQHENLDTAELRQVLNVPEGLARFAMQYLSEAGLVVPKDGSSDRVTLSAPYYRQTLRVLRSKHLLFE